VKDCRGVVIKEGDPVVWSRITGGTSTLAIGEVVKLVSEQTVKIKILQEGTSFGYRDQPKPGDIVNMGTPHRIMILPEKEMW
jgi:hypothetical protein